MNKLIRWRWLIFRMIFGCYRKLSALKPEQNDKLFIDECADFMRDTEL